MAVAAVGEVDRIGEPVGAGDEGVRESPVHHLSCTFQPAAVEVRSALADAAEGLVEDGIRPLGLHEPTGRQAHQQVPEWGRMEHAGVVDDDESRHGKLIAQAEVLRLPGQLVEQLSLPSILLLLVGQDIDQQHPPMAPDLAVWDLTPVKQLDHMGTGDV